MLQPLLQLWAGLACCLGEEGERAGQAFRDLVQFFRADLALREHLGKCEQGAVHLLSIATGRFDRLTYGAKREGGVTHRSAGPEYSCAKAGQAAGGFFLGDIELTGGLSCCPNSRVVGNLAACHTTQRNLHLADAGCVVGGSSNLLAEHPNLRTSGSTCKGTTNPANSQAAQTTKQALRPPKNPPTYGCAHALGCMHPGKWGALAALTGC